MRSEEAQKQVTFYRRLVSINILFVTAVSIIAYIRFLHHEDSTQDSCSPIVFVYEDGNQSFFFTPMNNCTITKRKSPWGDPTSCLEYKRIKSGHQLELPEQNQVWVPDTDNHLIHIYGFWSWYFIKTFSTLSGNCTNPVDVDYHPTAGSDKQGQIWVSCNSSTNPGWAVYQSSTFKPITFIPMPKALNTYLPYSIAIGEKFTVVSLRNTTTSSVFSLIQFDNETFDIRIISSLYGTNCLLKYLKTPTSSLYVFSYYHDNMYKLNFTDLSLLNRWNTTISPEEIMKDILADGAALG